MMKSSRICHEPGTTGKLSAGPVDNPSAAVQDSPYSRSKTIISVVIILDGFAMNSSTAPNGGSNDFVQISRNGGDSKSKLVGQGCTLHQSHLSD